MSAQPMIIELGGSSRVLLLIESHKQNKSY